MEVWAIVTVTKNGVQKALEISQRCKGEISFHIYTLDKYKVEGVRATSHDLKEIVTGVYKNYKTLLFIMASGIVVRMIAPLIQSKLVDPAILVMDDNGENVISLLSGHIGGANDNAKKLAHITGARPILTTSSDVNGKMAVDTFAEKHHLKIENFVAAKDITALILNEKKVCIVNEAGIQIQGDTLCDNVILDSENIEICDGAILITHKKEVELPIPYVQLIPQDITLGIGCRRDTETKEIMDFIHSTMDRLDLNAKSIGRLATVDIKQDEIGILEAKDILGVKLDIISRDEIGQVQDQFAKSPFVMKTIGVGNVSEPCGYLSSKGGTCILGRRALNGITLSVWKNKEENK